MSQNSDKMTEEIFKNPINKKKKLTNYNKKQVLATLKETSCHPKHLHTMHKRFRVTDVDIIKSTVYIVYDLNSIKYVHVLLYL